MAFEGYLLNAVGGGNLTPFIQENTYKATPNQREEIVAYRDDNTRDLTRVTATGTKTKIEFTTKKFNLAKKQAFQAIINNATVDALQRKISVKYWNDEDNVYKTSYFYIPDISFDIEHITSNDIKYSPYSVTLVEY